MHTTCRFLLVLPSLFSLAACGDDSSTTGSGGGGGEAIASSSSGSTAVGPASSNAQTSTSTGLGAGGDPTGGGGDPTGGGGEPICDFDAPSSERITICENYAAAVCNYIAECQPNFFLLVGDFATCVSVGTPSCVQQGNVVEDSMLECIGDLTSLYDGLQCDVAALDSPVACGSVGRLAAGQPCNSALECAGGVCSGNGPDDCNLCDTLVDAGDACDTDAYCPSSLSCVEGECVAPAADGAPCDSARDCEGGACAQGQCATAIIAQEGEDCGGITLCDPSASLLCDDDTLTCLDNSPPEPGLLGEACVPYQVDLGNFIFPVQLCEPGSICQDELCVASALPGDACDGGVVCLQSTCEAGICVPANPNLCACPE